MIYYPYFYTIHQGHVWDQMPLADGQELNLRRSHFAPVRLDIICAFISQVKAGLHITG